MNLKTQLVCIWSIPAFIVLYLIAFIGISGFVPPPSPMLSAPEVAAFFEQDRTSIRLGQLLCLVFSALFLPWTAVVTVHMARIEGRYPVLAWLQFGGALILCTFFMVCSLIWTIAAFRPELDPALVQLLNDAGWLVFVMAYPEYLIQLIAMAVVFLGDKSEQPFLPRWFCYFTFCVALAGTGGGFATFMKEGAFAWNGVLGFWTPVAFFLVWLLVLFPLLLKGVKRLMAEEHSERLQATAIKA
ncbi:hypothetical protein HBA55_04485 [Pseudomaricurvus alkylphenolicus]|jgi:hypothetical protein|uniref:hypothetical protein n=1 Tax=Pseudomaricurvus alkylphenolicus TaxID=1306991 RepID=UPI00142339D4|nr:hypothetical protein [Pseudomaricurvus alkylphenolicus]NIB38829.1 hypothetical protein [Pseudomaricurvus alkylphenolicus]